MYKVLRSLVPDTEMDAIDFLLYFLSTSLDWFPKEALFLIVYGGGSNGKSVLLEVFKRTLGEMYARRMSLSFVTDQGRTKSASADPAIMELKNARFVYYTESERNEKVNIAKVKEITGGDTISGRQIYATQENFRTNCNHMVTTNHRFVIETNEHAVWRRFLCYHFKIRFVEKINPTEKFDRLKDPDLIDLIKEDKRYQEAFLSILVHYHSMLYARYNGRINNVPKPTIDKETEDYRLKEDVYEAFIMSRVVYEEGCEPSNMDQFIEHFKYYYENSARVGEKFKQNSDDVAQIFRNSSIKDYIREVESGYVIENLKSLGHGESVSENAMLLKTWRNQHAN
jgi:phage/plasmid-associated DNA primase